MINGQDIEHLTPEEDLPVLIYSLQELIKTTPPETLAKVLAERELASRKKHWEAQQEIIRLQKLVTTDSLVTSVLSHGHFLSILEQEVADTNKKAESSSVLLGLDLDNFKITNETLGHALADKLLVAVGEAIGGSIRPGDSPGRTGGDEFSIILRRIKLKDAILVAERVRNAVIQATKEFKEDFSQSVSIGLCLIPKDLPAQNVRTLADAALYTVKDSGRNQIAIGSINPTTGSIETSIVPAQSQPTLAHMLPS